MSSIISLDKLKMVMEEKENKSKVSVENIVRLKDGQILKQGDLCTIKWWRWHSAKTYNNDVKYLCRTVKSSIKSVDKFHDSIDFDYSSPMQERSDHLSLTDIKIKKDGQKRFQKGTAHRALIIDGNIYLMGDFFYIEDSEFTRVQLLSILNDSIQVGYYDTTTESWLDRTILLEDIRTMLVIHKEICAL